MQDRSIVERVEILEQDMELLKQLPDRVAAVESQLVHLRTEMHADFSATRSDMQAMGARLNESDEETRRHMRVLHEDVIARIATIGEGRPPREPR